MAKKRKQSTKNRVAESGSGEPVSRRPFTKQEELEQRIARLEAAVFQDQDEE